MRTSLLLPVLLLVAPLSLAQAGVEVVVESRTYQVPEKGPRVEVNMAFLAGTMTSAVGERGFHKEQVEVLTLIEQGGTIAAYAKTVVSSTERLDSAQTDMIHQEFFQLAPGSYDLSVEVRDLLSGDTAVTRYSAPLAVGALGTDVQISGILFAERIEPALEGQPSKYGYAPVPLLSDYFPPAITALNFYAEIYNTDKVFGKDSAYALTYQIENFEKHAVFGQFKRVTRAKGRPVEPVMAEFDIAKLPSGNYVLAIEVLDRKGGLVARQEQFFQRNNPVQLNYDLQAMDQLDIENTFAGAFSNRDTLAEHIASLRPIADQLEQKIIDDRWNDRDMDLMKRFFYSFWANRNGDPEGAWRAYRQEVIKVNKLYGCRVQKGYQSDRGRVYLKYGPPNTQMDRLNEMDAYPYTIWHYYRAGKYTNRRFVFYQPDLVSDCFELLNSEVPGELQNPRWNQILHERNVSRRNVDPQRVNTQSGERADEFFDMPR
ncbi:MAG: GWxTD domain-containing protein [Flavobacteriales bacterium]